MSSTILKPDFPEPFPENLAEKSSRQPLGDQPSGFPLTERCVRAAYTAPEESTAVHRTATQYQHCTSLGPKGQSP